MEIRIGYISAINKDKETYRVNFPKLGIVSGEIFALDNKSFKVNDQVLCIYSAEDDGFVLGIIGRDI
ncbi:MAG: hypothetical protein LKJ25_06160 [Clostridia bacterium]|jgi:hypothetical protein|nr:hypothetical protein [Clostridia bacterium]